MNKKKIQDLKVQNLEFLKKNRTRMEGKRGEKTYGTGKVSIWN